MKVRIPYRVFLVLMGGGRRHQSAKLPGYLQRMTPAQVQDAVTRYKEVEKTIDTQSIEDHWQGVPAGLRQRWADYWKQYKEMTPEQQQAQSHYIEFMMPKFTQRSLVVVLALAPDEIRERYLGKG